MSKYMDIATGAQKVYPSDADVVEVVRCKDCIYCEKGGRLNMCIGLPLKTGYGFEMSVNENDYCSYGKRKPEK